MFQFPAFASPHLCIQCRMTGSLLPGFPIQTSPDHGPLPAPRGFSQAATSFLASCCQGIHHVRLISWPCNPWMSPAFAFAKMHSHRGITMCRLVEPLVQCTSLSSSTLLKNFLPLPETEKRTLPTGPFFPLPAPASRCFRFLPFHQPTFLEPVGIEPTTPCLQSRCSPS